jgi:hypothetical protein
MLENDETQNETLKLLCKLIYTAYKAETNKNKEIKNKENE